MKCSVLVILVSLLCDRGLYAESAQSKSTMPHVPVHTFTSSVVSVLPNDREMKIIKRWFFCRLIPTQDLQVGKKVVNGKPLFFILPERSFDEHGHFIAPQAAEKLFKNKLQVAFYLGRAALAVGEIESGVFCNKTEDAARADLRERNVNSVDDVIEVRRSNPIFAPFMEKYAEVINGN